MPWPTPWAICMRDLDAVLPQQSRRRVRSAHAAASRRCRRAASRTGGRDLISSPAIPAPASMPEKPTMPASGLVRRRPTCSAIIVPCVKPTRQVLLSSSPYFARVSSRKASTNGAAAAHAGGGEPGIEPRDAEPLVAHRIALAGIGRVGRVEHDVGHQRRQHRREPDQVVAVGAVAVQQDHEVAGRAAVVRPVAAVPPASSFLDFLSLLQSGMLRR